MSRVDTDGVNVLHDDIRARSVFIEVIILAVEYERHGVVAVERIYLVVGNSCCVERVARAVWSKE